MAVADARRALAPWQGSGHSAPWCPFREDFLSVRRRLPNDLPLVLLAFGTAILVGVVVAWFVVLAGTTAAAPVPATAVAATGTTAAAATSTVAAAAVTAATTTAPSPVAMSWQAAGGIVVHTDAIDPTLLGQEMRDAGFGWVAVLLPDGQRPVPLSPAWIERFRAASGLPAGGWSVLRDRPVADARLAAQLLAQNGLDFYIADAEQEYGYTEGTQHSSQHFARSKQFVDAFRSAEPSIPAALSSYCRPDQHDLGWAAWAPAGFAFLPQAYVNDVGPAVAPAACVAGAASVFPRSAIHPTVGIWSGTVPPQDYGQMLAAAGTTGFSLYTAENINDTWKAWGQEIHNLRIARAS